MISFNKRLAAREERKRRGHKETGTFAWGGEGVPLPRVCPWRRGTGRELERAVSRVNPPLPLAVAKQGGLETRMERDIERDLDVAVSRPHAGCKKRHEALVDAFGGTTFKSVLNGASRQSKEEGRDPWGCRFFGMR